MPRSAKISFDNRDKYIEIGFNIAFYRKITGYTQEALAEKAHTSRTHLSAIEAGGIVQSFSLEVLFNIANALKVEPYKLLKPIDKYSNET